MKNKKRPLIVVVLLLVVLVAGGAYWWTQRAKPVSNTLTLYGNIDIRQVQLAFNDAGRVSELLVQEGDAVHKGQVVARIDAVRYQDAVNRAQAALLAQQNVLAKLKAGTEKQDFYKRKLTLARYWMEREVPMTAGWVERAKAGADGLMELDAINF